MTAPTATMPVVSDDMHDSGEDLSGLARWPSLHKAVMQLDDLLTPTFDALDASAIAHQRRYRWVIFVTAFGGSLAVLASLAQLTLERLSYDAEWAATTEVVAIVVTVVAIGFGYYFGWLKHWLHDRFRAEQLRLLKFSSLLDPRMWGSATRQTAWQADVLNARDRIVALTEDDLKIQSERGSIPRLPTHDDCCDLASDAFDALLVFYRRKRIINQRDYFGDACARGVSFLDEPKLLPIFFVASVLMVAAHVVVAHFIAGESAAKVSTIFSAASAGLPVTWAGIRTYRSAREFSRNLARSAARREMLDEVARRLDEDARSDPTALLGELQICELVLDSDQREWLRLMREVEWYG
ncbi:MAG: DUF4231 domain-containing protein [bacterium]